LATFREQRLADFVKRYLNIFEQRRLWVLVIVIQVLIAVSLIVLPGIYVLFLLFFILMLAVFTWKPILGLALLIPFLPNYPIICFSVGAADISLLEPFLFLAFFCWILLIIRDREINIHSSNIDISILLLFCWCLFSLFWTISPARGMFQVLRILEGLAIYYLHIHLVKDKKDFNLLLWAWIIMGIIFSIVGFYETIIYGLEAAQRLLIQGTYTHLTRAVRASAFFTGPDALGFMLALAIVLAVIKFTTTSSKMKWLLLISLPFMFFVFLSTFSRKSFLGIFLALIYLLLHNRKAFKTILGISIIGGLLLLLLGSGGFLAVFWNRLQSYFMPLEVAIKHRATAWGLALRLFSDSPIMGKGIGSFYVIAQRLKSPLNIVHNFYLYILCELGLIGFIFILFWIFQIYQSFSRFFKINQDKVADAISTGLMCGLIIIMVQAMFRTIGLTDAIFWGFLGFSSAFLKVYAPMKAKSYNTLEKISPNHKDF